MSIKDQKKKKKAGGWYQELPRLEETLQLNA